MFSKLFATIKANLPFFGEYYRKCWLSYIINHQHESGGFVGKDGCPDLYYTRFALRGLEAVEATEDRDIILASIEKCSSYLESEEFCLESMVDIFCLADSIEVISKFVAGKSCAFTKLTEQLRLELGLHEHHFGFSQFADQPPGLYHTFLGYLAKQSLFPDSALSIDDKLKAKATEFFTIRRKDNAGFSDYPGDSMGQTNPTAAAIGTASLFNIHGDKLFTETASFFKSMQDKSGGFLAFDQSPDADLLSTFVSLVALSAIGDKKGVSHSAAAKFVKNCMTKDKGFGPSPSCKESDLEYTYYGISSLAILQARCK
ncbi:MAG: hypothetical protein JXR97_04390 [Planctomycetes bacterium]|nr:hypothetical protein [Planctomycetota bacterium]